MTPPFRPVAWLVCALAVAGHAAPLWARQDPAPAPTAPPDPAPPPASPPANPARALPNYPDLPARLRALTPADPRGYFLLAEDLAAESHDPDARALARTLFVLAFELDRRAASPAGIARSACLGLAATVPSPDDRAWLQALAAGMSDAHNGPVSPGASRPPRDAGQTIDPRTAHTLATALGLVRAGEGRRALALFARPGVAALFEAFAPLLDEPGQFGGDHRFRQAMDQWSACPECRNRRFVSRPAPGGARPSPCGTCYGAPGPQWDNAELARHLRMESALLRGVHKLWSSQTLADRAAPLREPDPAAVAAHFGVDPQRPLWRDGRWTAPPAPAASPNPAPGRP